MYDKNKWNYVALNLPRQQANLGPILGQYWCQLVARHPASDAAYQLSDIILADGNKYWTCTIDIWNMFFHSEVERCLQVPSHFTSNHGERKFCLRLGLNQQPLSSQAVPLPVSDGSSVFPWKQKEYFSGIWELANFSKFPEKLSKTLPVSFLGFEILGQSWLKIWRPVSWPNYRCR